ncbi:23S rRNA (pseudouridine(1915)-N(3))-methyltransferase RlmH [Candidatus Uhrbacteria bacterium CG10_big_fil_rev_8_21_14_0_10_50_16]|uniref:Ribosomal RNA large subunit methyltransferase H n=1 Tax=Candidatus Uhrbacteria bacterium CG10_big_fil_rev_8_21_14_0_10_50_16 TaxID=1975039 RepID=A0A2H0RNF7_9BACT|nr:MAG: 23S rRNA (pseudouridine(1915)-N(3))-methyltransferase RlmH [Candidatus Uhrbacteria bacterium CG10_big_fil_rev_8_21_14_0_10_50_16]
MYKFTIIHVGKLKNGPHQELVDGYLKRLSPFAQVELLEVKEEKFGTAKEREYVLSVEAEKIASILPSDARPIVMDADGREPNSTELAEWIDTLAEQQTQHLAFIVGGPLGLADVVKRSADKTFALSKQTYPHDLALVMLTEQLYRAMTILAGKTYHY